jgi:hypothetical protein
MRTSPERQCLAPNRASYRIVQRANDRFGSLFALRFRLMSGPSEGLQRVEPGLRLNARKRTFPTSVQRQNRPMPLFVMTYPFGHKDAEYLQLRPFLLSRKAPPPLPITPNSRGKRLAGSSSIMPTRLSALPPGPRHRRQRLPRPRPRLSPRPPLRQHTGRRGIVSANSWRANSTALAIGL